MTTETSRTTRYSLTDVEDALYAQRIGNLDPTQPLDAQIAEALKEDAYDGEWPTMADVATAVARYQHGAAILGGGATLVESTWQIVGTARSLFYYTAQEQRVYFESPGVEGQHRVDPATRRPALRFIGLVRIPHRFVPEQYRLAIRDAWRKE